MVLMHCTGDLTAFQEKELFFVHNFVHMNGKESAKYLIIHYITLGQDKTTFTENNTQD